MARKIRIRWEVITATQARRVTRRGSIYVTFVQHPDAGAGVKAIALAAPMVRGKTVLEAHTHRELGEFPTTSAAAVAAVKFLESPAALELLDAALCACHREAG